MKATPNHNNYNTITPVYDTLGRIMYFGALQKAQEKFLNEIPKNSRILFIGGGTGFLLNVLLEQAQPKEVWYIEKSWAMIRKSKKAVKHPLKKRVYFLHGTQEDIPAEEQFDVVLSFFFFDQFEFYSLSKIFLRIDAHVKEGGIWLWADFIPPQTWWQKVLMRMMMLFFSYTTHLGTQRVYDVPALFLKRGYQLCQEAYFYGGFIRSVFLKK